MSSTRKTSRVLISAAYLPRPNTPDPPWQFVWHHLRHTFGRGGTGVAGLRHRMGPKRCRKSRFQGAGESAVRHKNGQGEIGQGLPRHVQMACVSRRASMAGISRGRWKVACVCTAPLRLRLSSQRLNSSGPHRPRRLKPNLLAPHLIGYPPPPPGRQLTPPGN